MGGCFAAERDGAALSFRRVGVASGPEYLHECGAESDESVRRLERLMGSCVGDVATIEERMGEIKRPGRGRRVGCGHVAACVWCALTGPPSRAFGGGGEDSERAVVRTLFLS